MINKSISTNHKKTYHDKDPKCHNEPNSKALVLASITYNNTGKGFLSSKANSSRCGSILRIK